MSQEDSLNHTSLSPQTQFPLTHRPAAFFPASDTSAQEIYFTFRGSNPSCIQEIQDPTVAQESIRGNCVPRSELR